MIYGQERFTAHFKDFSDCYIAIGGLAAHAILEVEGLNFRATKDFDLILVVEALRPEFFEAFWQFIHEGGYQVRELDSGKRQYYRFQKPTIEDFPAQIELFSRLPDVIKPHGDIKITPIPVDAELSSLSAILMDDAYYNFARRNTVLQEDGIHHINAPALIVLKIKAYFDLSERKQTNEQINSKNISKHQRDVFRLGATLTGEESIPVPKSIHDDVQEFISLMQEDPPDLKPLLKQMGIDTNLTAEQVLDILEQIFQRH